MRFFSSLFGRPSPRHLPPSPPPPPPLLLFFDVRYLRWGATWSLNLKYLHFCNFLVVPFELVDL